MKSQAIFVRIIATLLTVVSTHLFSQQALPQQTAEQEIARIVAQSQQALSEHNEQKALSLIQQGLIKFPNQEELQIQLARTYVEQKRDRQAIGLLNSILLANNSSRNAKLELAQIFGYRENYRESDRLYRELLTADPDDETAILDELLHDTRVGAAQRERESTGEGTCDAHGTRPRASSRSPRPTPLT